MTQFELPPTLKYLIKARVWPSAESRRDRCLGEQQINPLVPAERLKAFAPDEETLCLYPPPFSTVAAQRDGPGDFWDDYGALGQINAEQALIIGDFGLGADAPIILEYSRNPLDPPVLRLRWGKRAGRQHTEWVLAATDFKEFAQVLGLLNS